VGVGEEHEREREGKKTMTFSRWYLY